MECQRVFHEMKISKEEANYLTEATQLQSKSLVWFEHRHGRLTASRIGLFCHTSLARPSQTLISAVFQLKFCGTKLGDGK